MFFLGLLIFIDVWHVRKSCSLVAQKVEEVPFFLEKGFISGKIQLKKWVMLSRHCFRHAPALTHALLGARA